MRAMIAGVHTISYCNFTGSRFSRTNLCKATEKLKFVYDATSRFIRSNFHFFVLSQCCAYVLVGCQHTFHLVRVRKIACFVLQYLFWSPQIWLQMDWFPIKNIRLLSPQTRLEIVPCLLKNIQWIPLESNPTLQPLAWKPCHLQPQPNIPFSLQPKSQVLNMWKEFYYNHYWQLLLDSNFKWL